MKKKGFTLIEMLIVIIIIGVLAATLVPRIGNARDRANDVARMSDIMTISSALSSYYMDHPAYPDVKNVSELEKHGLTRADYGLGGDIPKDPRTLQPYSYKMLDGGKHFIICATLSDGSTAGNANVNYALHENPDIDPEKIREEADKLKERINNLEEYINKIRSEIKEIQILEEQIQEKINSDGHVKELFEVKKKLENEISKLKDGLLTTTDSKELEAIISKINDTQENLSKLEKEIEVFKEKMGINEDEREIKKIEDKDKEITRYRNELNEAMEQLSSLQNQRYDAFGPKVTTYEQAVSKLKDKGPYYCYTH